MSHLRLENRHTGEVLDIRRTRERGVECLELRGTLPPRRQGAILHVHHTQDEEGFVTAGVLSAMVDGTVIQAGPGEVVSLPRGVPHSWWNAGDEPLAFQGMARPAADLDRYLQAVFDVMNRSPADRPSLFYLAHASLRHRETQRVILMPAWIQTPLFQLIVAVGTLLGRYRGIEWPGCPAKCSGAPPPAQPDTPSDLHRHPRGT
jgi:quercetin dioxygenase-like cupin family protein